MFGGPSILHSIMGLGESDWDGLLSWARVGAPAPGLGRRGARTTGVKANTSLSMGGKFLPQPDHADQGPRAIRSLG